MLFLVSLSIALTGLISLKLSFQPTEDLEKGKVDSGLGWEDKGSKEGEERRRRKLEMRKDRLVVVSSLERIVDH